MNYRLLKDLHGLEGNKVVIAETGSVYEKEADGLYYTGKYTRGLSAEVVESNPEWFEPIYEFKVGDWLYYKFDTDNPIITQITKISGEEIYCLIDGNVEYFFRWQFVENANYELRLATQSEIDSVTKKFPFDYNVDNAIYTARECRVVQADTIAISQGEGYKCLVFLTESAWKKIGELKGWAL